MYLGAQIVWQPSTASVGHPQSVVIGQRGVLRHPRERPGALLGSSDSTSKVMASQKAFAVSFREGNTVDGQNPAPPRMMIIHYS